MVVKSEIYTGLTNYADGRPCEIGRIEYVETGLVVLFHRYTDGRPSSTWRPTWVGSLNQDIPGAAVRLPEGLLTLGEEAYAHLSLAKIITTDLTVDQDRWQE